MRIVFISLLFVLGMELQGKQLPLSVRAQSAILINADTGAVIYEKNADEILYPASLTKIATCLYALHIAENDLDKICIAERDSVATVTESEMKKSNYTYPAYLLTVGTSHIGIKTGEKMSLLDLMNGMMIASGGDAANVIAESLGGTVPQYMEDLNAYLESIGCINTHYLNPHGLHHPEHQTTARDLAMMSREAMQYPAFRKIVKTVNYTRPKTNKQEQAILVQTNRLLKKGKFFYPHAIGIKTGFTTPAMHCLVAAAKKDDRTLIAVILKSPERDDMFLDAKIFFEEAFQEQKVSKTLVGAGAQKHSLQLKKASSVLNTYIEEPITVCYYPSEEPSLKCYLTWDKLELPIKKGDRVGEIAIKDETGTVIKRTLLYSQNDVKQNYSFYLILGGVIILLLIITYKFSMARATIK